MIMISFRSKRDKDDMIHKARKMKEFADEFLECVESSEDEYEREYRDGMERDDERSYRSRRMRDGRYSY